MPQVQAARTAAETAAAKARETREAATQWAAEVGESGVDR